MHCGSVLTMGCNPWLPRAADRRSAGMVARRWYLPLCARRERSMVSAGASSRGIQAAPCLEHLRPVVPCSGSRSFRFRPANSPRSPPGNSECRMEPISREPSCRNRPQSVRQRISLEALAFASYPPPGEHGACVLAVLFPLARNIVATSEVYRRMTGLFRFRGSQEWRI